LEYAHARGVVHRDISPSNMIVTEDGTLKLTDFGLAKSVTDLRLTLTGTLVGSLYYTSPEQFEVALKRTLVRTFIRSALCSTKWRRLPNRSALKILTL
jgi:serine/threonine protein kinase